MEKEIKNIEIFRSLCLENLTPTIQRSLPKVEVHSEKSVLIVETRILPHFEYNIRLLLMHIGEGWSFNFFTGHLSFDYWREVCRKISPNINVLSLGMDTLSIDQYSLLLLDKNFWKEIQSDKVLTFQEDCISFRKGVDAFLRYDYVGAPWTKKSKVSKSSIGNGGVSIRTRSAILEALERFHPHDFSLRKERIKVLKGSDLMVIPEDIFYSLAFTKMKKKFPRYEEAKEFSIELCYHPNPIFGHRIWRNEDFERDRSALWIDLLQEKVFSPLKRGEIPLEV
jgi:hypothetical protein